MTLEALIEFCKRQKNLYIYGAGGYGRILMTYLDEMGIHVSGFVETKKNADIIMGKPVLELREISRYESGFVLGIGQRYEDEIIALLKEADCNNYFSISPQLMIEIQKNTRYKKEISVKVNFVNVLLYHRIVANRKDPWGIAVSPTNFEQHIRYIKKHYPVIRFEDDWSKVNEKSIVITFDDGYSDNYKFAFPILERYQVPATFFVSTGNIGGNMGFWWDRLFQIFENLPDNLESILINGVRISLRINDVDNVRFIHKELKKMSSNERDYFLDELESRLHISTDSARGNQSLNCDELKHMSNSLYVTIGGHTVSHPVLANELLERQQWELEESKTTLEKIIGRRVEVFSYPFGSRKDFTVETENLVSMCGYKKAAVNWRGTASTATNVYRIPRNAVSDGNGDDIARQIRGTWCMFGNE